MTGKAQNSKYEQINSSNTDSMRERFLRSHPEYAETSSLDDMRDSGFSRLDELSEGEVEVYLGARGTFSFTEC